MTSNDWQAQLKQVIDLIETPRPEDMSEAQWRERRAQALGQLRQLFRDTPSDVGLPAQAAAVRRAATNHRGHIGTLIDLLARRQRPALEVLIAMQWLPGLLAAADALEQSNGRRWA
jgi:hypothetical protein